MQASPTAGAKRLAASGPGGGDDVGGNLQFAAVGQTDPRFNKPGYDIVSWSIDFLNALGYQPTPQNVSSVVAWANAESSGYNPHASGGLNNPLNVVATANDGHSGQGGVQGNIADFPDPATGAKAAAALFKGNRNAKPILDVFSKSGGVAALNSAINQFYASWGGHITLSTASVNADQITAASSQTGGTQAQTTSWVSDTFGNLVPGFSQIPVLGDLVTAGKASQALAGGLLGVFSNWRYVLEVLIGWWMILAGILIIAHDTGADRKALQGTKTAAAVGAVAA